MTNITSTNFNQKYLPALAARLDDFLALLRDDSSSAAGLQLAQSLLVVGDMESTALAAAENIATPGTENLVRILCLQQILPVCQSVLSFFESNKQDLDSQVRELLAACIVVAQKEVESAMQAATFSGYEEHRVKAVSQLFVYVTDTLGFNLGFSEDILVEKYLDAESVESEIRQLMKAGDVEAPANPAAAVVAETVADRSPVENSRKRPDRNQASQETTRVKSQLLEDLMSHSEELVQIRNALADIAEQQEDQNISELSNRLASVSNNILNDLLKTRLRPIGILFRKYNRIVRELSKDLNKKIALNIIGENVEIDSNIIDAITEPLTHLVRNSIDHGIESPEERLAAGKPETGCLTLHAFNESGKVVIRISDDGKGVDKQKVLQKAVENGLVPESEAKSLTERNILNLIFDAGLSTAEKVTAVSGRGVGLDAVRRKVEESQGVIELSSDYGKGIEILLRFPLTMATIKVILFKIHDVSYAIPSAEVSRVIRLANDDEETSVRFDSGQTLLHQHGKIIPLIEPAMFLDKLNKRASIQESYSSGLTSIVIVFQYRSKEWGLCVDEVYSFMDIVIKPMAAQLNPSKLFSGIAVLGSGELAYIVNLEGLLKCRTDQVETIEKVLTS